MPSSCPTNTVGLECDNAQKNQQTTQNEYYGLCMGFDSCHNCSGDRLPSPSEYPSRGVLDTGVIEKGRPFWLSSSICNNKRLHEMMKESTDHMLKSAYWTVSAKQTSDLVAQATGRPISLFVDI